MRKLFLLALAVPGVAFGQVVQRPVDLTATNAAIAAAQAKADAASAAAAAAQASAATTAATIPSLSSYAKTTDVAAAIAAATPAPCAAPLPDTLGGAAGTGTPCITRPDATRPTQVMPSQATTLPDGMFVGTWPGTFPTTPTTAIASAKTATDPYSCQVATLTTTGYSGKCWKTTQTLTLPNSALALLNLQLTTASPAPAGLTVMVVGRQ